MRELRRHGRRVADGRRRFAEIDRTINAWLKESGPWGYVASGVPVTVASLEPHLRDGDKED